MSGQYKRRRKHRVNRILMALMSVVIVAACAFISVSVIQYIENRDGASYVSDVSSEIPSVPDEPEPIVKVSTATVAATGDLLMHLPIINAAKTGDAYNFDDIFTYFKPYVSAADYAVANLETTLRGTADGYSYSGYPQFNCPDEIVQSVKSSGFQMLLTANNHSYDTRLAGLLRTIDVVDASGLDRLGTYKEETERKYLVKEVNGIKLGMICYTYETDVEQEGRKALNGILLAKEATNLINSFSYSRLDAFYSEINGYISEMKTDGAEAIILYIHWGDEYRLTANEYQKTIAQQMCNLGVDVIVGGHAHVVEPVELLTSETDSAHKTVCLYSMGNAVSNQRTSRASIKTGHTEDGVLFSFTFAKYSDGTVILEGVDILPTWVNLFQSKSGKQVYQIIPLDSSIDDWRSAFDLTESSEKAARNSYDRTVKIVGDGLQQVNEYLSSVPTTDTVDSDLSPAA